MKIKNNYKKEVLVYFYKPTDTAYLAAMAERHIPKGETGEYREDTFPQVKISIRDGITVFDAQIVKPGQKYDMGGDYILTGDKKFIKASVAFEKTELKTKNIKTFQFVDARDFNSETSRKISNSFSSAYSQSKGITSEYSESEEFSISGEVGGWFGNRESRGGVNGKISAGFRSQVVRGLTETYEQSVTKTWSKTVSDEFNFKPGKFYMLEITWQVKIQEGTADYFGETTDYAVIHSAEGSLTKPAAFNSPEELPKAAEVAYKSLLKSNVLKA
jgi:hypothetical protein